MLVPAARSLITASPSCRVAQAYTNTGQSLTGHDISHWLPFQLQSVSTNSSSLVDRLQTRCTRDEKGRRSRVHDAVQLCREHLVPAKHTWVSMLDTRKLNREPSSCTYMIAGMRHTCGSFTS
ncbi:hypothetical protein K437DRAFT_51899 [Tilletiaria anomala UBC 951]|uniref:Uncharacterized protein n=1 Tax=Tilletiaria anomala (strain ATCC 24038 / CBS 436.72 / UBC 951) TaxID=1037660 RepID=A0A066WCH5_TILAU|nr:uncharacterized protein K437DRAFT_51899 [Tilletiaria anomala UBC 951]KDN51441.1 hypothetical protein K437DRAFT_51899 [Tilletiaria anomala UBC 951]